VPELAERLELSRNTVKTHLRRVFRKCEVSSLAQLAALVATGPRLR
jgi:DNA-binding CsgD family transcriptional regulator